MDFPVAIRTKKYTFRELGLDPGPAPRMPLIRNRKVLSGIVKMMKFQGFWALLISAKSTLTPGRFDSHQPDLFSPLVDGFDEVGPSVAITSFL